jgi:hypothetical protein
MKDLVRFTTTFGLLSTLIVTAATSTQAQPKKPVLPNTPPNTKFSVERQTGKCPTSIGVWISFRYYEGGGEHTVIADTLAIAGSSRIVRSNKKLVEFTAPLKKNFASCVGVAKSDEYEFYQFRLQNGKITFRVELPPDTPANPSEFTARSIVGSRPYVRWAIAD